MLGSSGIVAILLDEPARPQLVKRIATAPMVAVAAPTLVEVGIVLSARLGRDATAAIDGFLAAADVVVVEFGPEPGGSRWTRGCASEGGGTQPP